MSSRVVSAIKAGTEEITEVEFQSLQKGDRFFVNGFCHEVGEDAHYSGDATFDGYILYDTEGTSWFSDDLDSGVSRNSLTKDEIIDYLRKQGRPDPDATWIEEFQTGGAHPQQYVECVRNNYDLCDFDRWLHLQKVMGIEMSFKCAMAIENALYEEDLEVLELRTPEDIVRSQRLDASIPKSYFTVDTEVGTLQVFSKGAENDYPGVYIDIAGDNVINGIGNNTVALATIEYDPLKKKIQTVVYGDGKSEEFTHLVEHENVVMPTRKISLEERIVAAKQSSGGAYAPQPINTRDTSLEH